MFERTISCSSLSKTYSITGWRLGYIIAPKYIVDGAKKVHDFLTVGAAAPLQEAAVVGLEFDQSYYNDLLAKYSEKRELFIKGLDDIGIQFVEKAKEVDAKIIAISTLMTTTMDGMAEVINILNQQNIREKYKVMVGGGPISQGFADKIGADGYSVNAAEAVRLARKLVGGAA